MRRQNWVVLCIVAAFAVPSSAIAREWVDATGKFRVEAELVVVRGEQVILERADGKMINLPISRLSKSDQAFLKQSSESTPTSKATQNSDKDPRRSRPTAANQEGSLASRAMGMLKRHCFRCHGEGGSGEGGFNFVSDRERLVSAGYVHPRDPVSSPLITRMLSRDDPMPPEGETPRPTAEEIDTISRWIRQGAPSSQRQETREFLDVRQVNQMILLDLNALPRNDRQYMRYFNTTHLYNAGVSSEELATYRVALAKLLNSLSWNRQLAGLHSVGKGNHLFRIDLRDLRWTERSWNQILGLYPYPLASGSRESLQIQGATGTELSVVRADWFVASASRPPLYHDLLDLPSTDKRLETKLQVDVGQNIKQERVVRVGFARSGVSTNNRLLERHESAFGAYWKSYDFASNLGRKNLFQHPMGPGITGDTFRHDGGEIIFQLPNGMLAFMLTDGVGRRIDQGPIDIVSDPRQPDRTVVNGVSCVSCHYGGFIQKSDEIRKHVIANRSAYRNSEKILALYSDPRVADRWIKQDTNDYLTALKQSEIGIENPTSVGEPIVLIANRFQNELDLVQVSTELGIPPQKFLDQIARVRDPGMKRALGALKVPSAVIKRETFEGLFRNLVLTLNVGRVPPGVGARIASSGVVQSKRRSSRIASMNRSMAGDVPQGAVDAFRAGVDAMNRRDWQTANDEFAVALRHSRDDAFTARVYEKSIQLFERGVSIDSLLKAHKFLLDTCTNSAEMEQAKVNLFNSLLRFSGKSFNSWSSSKQPTTIQWRPDSLPTSITNAVAELFERELDESPDHEPSLRVMKTYWQEVRNDQSEYFSILKRLDKILSARGESLEGMDRSNYASLHASKGDASKAAALFSELAKGADGSAVALYGMKEALAWAKAGQGEKGVEPLKRAQRFYERGGSSAAYSLDKVGDAFVSLNEHFLAAKAYRSALRLEESPGQIETLQGKIKDALAKSSGPEASADSLPVAMESDELMDPARRYRVAAKEYEKSAARNRTSAFYSRIQAAENWMKAKDSEQAIRVLRKAEVDLGRKPNGGADHEHKNIAAIYQAAGCPDESLSHWIEAIKRCKSDYTVSQYQQFAKAVLLESPSVPVSDSMKTYLDPKYPLRVKAKVAEEQAVTVPSSKATNLVNAATYWAQSEDWSEVDRVGKVAEETIKRLQPSSSYHPGERLYVKLAEAYVQSSLYQRAIDCYVGAIGFAGRDDDAIKYHHQVKLICSENGLPQPEIPAEAKKKLDPLNRYRVSAEKKEQSAKETTSLSLKLSYWMQASKDWLKAEERERACAAADEHAALLLKQSSAKDYAVKLLGAQYEKIGNHERAIKTYQYALKISTSDYQKKKLQEKIDTLK